jgi:hypothetical protein
MDQVIAAYHVAAGNPVVVASVSFAAGLAAANVPLIVKTVVCSKPISLWIKAHPEVAEQIADEFKKDVDEVAKKP